MNQRTHKWLLYWSIWMLLGLYMATMDLTRFPSANFIGHLLPMNLLQNIAWGLGGLGVIAIARHWPLVEFNRRELKNWSIELLACAVIAALSLVLLWAVNLMYVEQPYLEKMLANPGQSLMRFFSMYFHVSLLLMWAVLGGWHSMHIYQKYRQREVEAAQLESRLAQAQNAALQMQLRPHFLFNTLNSISALIHSDADKADRMVSGLADLLRMTLDSGSSQQIPLSREIAIIDAYLNIELIRFQDRLQASIEVPATCQNALVPAFLLQPLVENSIKHGVADNVNLSTIDIRVRQEDQWLILEVLDNGKGLGTRTRNGNGCGMGIGTQNTEARLQLLYQSQHSFTLENIPGLGTRALVRIPFTLT
ncbi:sensor histidine kinase [Undibacterium flavidum]|uniref:Histidine kinase n=1 Tax=Undibacterium flavidum TaxID=2762297 RepID=A0ABR6YH39_9BURK|nr:histidine kinase [Undibacterium flavidum]MBC3875823.1 histidine kinase [Undibacterium flavidum]